MFHGSSMTARYQIDDCDMVLWSGEKGLEFMRWVDEAVQVTHLRTSKASKTLATFFPSQPGEEGVREDHTAEMRS